MKNENTSKTLHLINSVFFVFLFSAFIIVAISLVKNLDVYHNKDFFTFWLGGRLVSQGLDVYDPTFWVRAHAVYGATWIPNLYYVYPLTTAILFVPLGMLPIASAALVWLLFSFIFIAASLVLILRLWMGNAWAKLIIPMTLGLLLFRPVILIFLMGQIDALLLFILVLSIFLMAKGKNLTAHVLLGVLILKPNIGIPILCLYALWLLSQKQWQNLLTMAVSALMLLALPLIFDPHWIEKYIHVGLYKCSDQNLYPSLRGLAGLITGNVPTVTSILWLLFSVVVLFGVVVFILKARRQFQGSYILMLAMIVTLLVTPYMRSYDFLLLLIPILYMLSVFLLRGGSFLKANMLFLGSGIYSFALVFLADRLGHDIWSVVFPLSVLLVFLLTWDYDKKGPEKSHSGNAA